MEKEALIKELNELSQDALHNKERMIEISKILLADHYWFTREKNKDQYEHADLRICKHWIQRQSCYWCIGEAYCRIEDQKYLYSNS